MNELNINKVLIKKRRERGLTQEDIAKYFGVSKSAVSKWETGQSYPDVLLLPQLATYFDISIDELLGYIPQLTKEQIKEFYKSFSERFTKEGYEILKDDIEETIRKYHCCYPFLTAMSQWFLNHCILGNEDEKKEMLNKTYEISNYVIENSKDTFLIQSCKNISAYISLINNDFNGVFENLGDHITPSTEGMRASLLIQTFMVSGNMDKSSEMCQVMIYELLSNLMNILQNYQKLNLNNITLQKEVYAQEKALVHAFNLKDNSMNSLYTMDLLAAQSFLTNGMLDEAITPLKDYVNLMEEIKFPLSLNRNEYFNKINPWIDENLYLGDTMILSEK